MRNYSILTSADLETMRTQRLGQLEQEHYSNYLALEGVKSVPVGSEEDQATKDAEIARLENNLAVLDSTLDALESQAPVSETPESQEPEHVRSRGEAESE